MDKQNDMAQLRYLEEAAISLKRAGFDTGRIEDRHLPVSWNGSYLCRISGKGSVLYRQQNVEANGAQAELQNLIDIAKTTSEYMAMMERAPAAQGKRSGGRLPGPGRFQRHCSGGASHQLWCPLHYLGMGLES